jgi:hypothetical protein
VIAALWLATRGCRLKPSPTPTRVARTAFLEWSRRCAEPEGLVWIAIALIFAATQALAADSAFSPTETAAIYKAAGFTVDGSKIIGCDSADPSWPRSSFFIEGVDLSGDGKPEAIVSEGNVACYGGAEMGFTVLAKNPDGSWRTLATGSGATAVLKTSSNGWLDIEYGGPGMQKQPVLRWNGKAYQ